MGRILLFTGKGGVGKTSVAAAHARYSALEGKKTLLVSTDMAHNLSDLLETPLGKTVQEICPNLFAWEIDPNHIMGNDFQEIKQALLNMLTSSGVPVTNLEQIAVFPGMAELFSLLKIREIYDSGEFERIIVDCAPTGETLSLLKFPELLSWYMEKFFPLGKGLLRVLAPVSQAVFKVRLPDQAALSDAEKLYVKLTQLQELLKNRAVTSVRLVAMPEKMVVEETKRSYMYLNLFDFAVDGIFINRILPRDIHNPFFSEWMAIQTRYITELEEVFADLPVYKIPWFDTDLNGLAGIDRIVQASLSGRDLFQVRADLKGETYEKTADGYKLKLYLPGVQKGELQLHDSLTGIIIKIGNYKRNIPKPATLRNYTVTTAKLEEKTLAITFQEKEKAGVTG